MFLCIHLVCRCISSTDCLLSDTCSVRCRYQSLWATAHNLRACSILRIYHNESAYRQSLYQTTIRFLAYKLPYMKDNTHTRSSLWNGIIFFWKYFNHSQGYLVSCAWNRLQHNYAGTFYPGEKPVDLLGAETFLRFLLLYLPALYVKTRGGLSTCIFEYIINWVSNYLYVLNLKDFVYSANIFCQNDDGWGLL